MIAKLQNIVKRYGENIILDHLNLEVHEGEILGLLGPNGAGKTTTIRSLTGLINVDSGSIQVFGKNQSMNNLDIRRELGLVTQEITVFSDLNVLENLRYFGGLYGLKGQELKNRVKEVLDFIDLNDHIKKKPGQLSGGMARRLNIGCALVHRPKLVIMDEPTVGIDPQSRNHILESVKKLAAQGTTVIYTTHYMEEVQAICDRIVIMDGGRVIEEGTLDEMIRRIQREDKIRMTAVAATAELTASLEKIAGVTAVRLNGNDYEITSGVGSGNINRVMEIAQRHGGITSFSEDKLNLEDVFLTLTGRKLRESDGEV